MTYIRPSEIAKTLDVHVMSVYRWIKNGELRAIKIGSMVRVRQSDLESFVEHRSQG